MISKKGDGEKWSFSSGMVIVAVHMVLCVHMCVTFCPGVHLRCCCLVQCPAQDSQKKPWAFRTIPEMVEHVVWYSLPLPRCLKSTQAIWSSFLALTLACTGIFKNWKILYLNNTNKCRIPVPHSSSLIPSWSTWTRQGPGYIRNGLERAFRMLWWHWDSVLEYRCVCCLLMSTFLQIGKRAWGPFSVPCPILSQPTKYCQLRGGN
jgi:hypothetical protein